MSMALDKDGHFIKGSNGLAVSTRSRAFQARLELGLPRGAWLHAPDRGHNLKRFDNVRKTPAIEDDYIKEVNSYLRGYDPETLEIVSGETTLETHLEIEGEA